MGRKSFPRCHPNCRPDGDGPLYCGIKATSLPASHRQLRNWTGFLPCRFTAATGSLKRKIKPSISCGQCGNSRWFYRPEKSRRLRHTISQWPGWAKSSADGFQSVLFAFIIFKLMVSIIPTFWGKCKRGIPFARRIGIKRIVSLDMVITDAKRNQHC